MRVAGTPAAKPLKKVVGRSWEQSQRRILQHAAVDRS